MTRPRQRPGAGRARPAAQAAARRLHRRADRPGRPPGQVRAAAPLGRGQRRQELIAEVDRAGLTGRGGAGFPTGASWPPWRSGGAPVVIANGTEGEPASAKDKVLMAQSPHLVLDGAALAADLVGAARSDHRGPSAVSDIMAAAVAERRRAGLDRARISVVAGADRFVGGRGQRRRALAGTRRAEAEGDTAAAVRARPGRAADAGPERRDAGPPGPDRQVRRRWFRAAGTPREPGSMLVTVRGG